MSAFDTAWNLMKGRTLRGKWALSNKERLKEKKSRESRESIDPERLERLMRELAAKEGYSGSEFKPE